MAIEFHAWQDATRVINEGSSLLTRHSGSNVTQRSSAAGYHCRGQVDNLENNCKIVRSERNSIEGGSSFTAVDDNRLAHASRKSFMLVSTPARYSIDIEAVSRRTIDHRQLLPDRRRNGIA